MLVTLTWKPLSETQLIRFTDLCYLYIIGLIHTEALLKVVAHFTHTYTSTHPHRGIRSLLPDFLKPPSAVTPAPANYSSHLPSEMYTVIKLVLI